jgi:hypothetical protein
VKKLAVLFHIKKAQSMILAMRSIIVTCFHAFPQSLLAYAGIVLK